MVFVDKSVRDAVIEMNVSLAQLFGCVYQRRGGLWIFRGIAIFGGRIRGVASSP